MFQKIFKNFFKVIKEWFEVILGERCIFCHSKNIRRLEGKIECFDDADVGTICRQDILCNDCKEIYKEKVF